MKRSPTLRARPAKPFSGGNFVSLSWIKGAALGGLLGWEPCSVKLGLDPATIPKGVAVTRCHHRTPGSLLIFLKSLTHGQG